MDLRKGVIDMTLDDLKRLDREYLTQAQVADVLGCDAQDVRVAARKCPERLGFNVAVIGTRVKVPRLAFIRWMEGDWQITLEVGHGRS